jgi:cysteine synthase B
MILNIKTSTNKKAECESLESSPLAKVGNTPLFKISNILTPIPIFAKAEWFNPGGSVKDRAALNMILKGEESEKLKPGKIILDATSGNTGIAYAWIGAAKGYPVKLCVPGSISVSRKKILLSYGAELIFTNPQEMIDGAIQKAKEIYHQNPDLYFYPDQYSNSANWQAHYETTAKEIWEQTSGKITHFIAGLGTSGTFIGTARRLKKLNPKICCISVQPDSSFHGMEGLKNMASSLVPSIYDERIADKNLFISSEKAYSWVRELAKKEGLLVGPSSGGAFAAAKEVAVELEKEKSNSALIVTVFPDSGEKYLEEDFWNEEEKNDCSD